MHEFPQERPSSENLKAPDKFPSVEQMVTDLREYWDFCCDGDEYPNGLTQTIFPFEDRYGYPDPKVIWGSERARKRHAEKTGTTPPERSLPRLAADIFDYQLTAEAMAREGKPVPTFEEVSGYLDPRETRPDAPPPASPEANGA